MRFKHFKKAAAEFQIKWKKSEEEQWGGEGESTEVQIWQMNLV